MSSNLVRTVKALVFGKASVKDVGLQLRELTVDQQALVLASAYQDRLERATPGEYDHVAETDGRRVSNLLAELPDPRPTFHALIEAGDTELALNVVRSHLGEYSGMAEYLTANQIRVMIRKDPFMKGNIETRVLYIAHTLLVETPMGNKAVHRFFDHFRLGRAMMVLIKDLAESGNEDASVIMRAAAEREIKVLPEVEVEDLEVLLGLKTEVSLSNDEFGLGTDKSLDLPLTQEETDSMEELDEAKKEYEDAQSWDATDDFNSRRPASEDDDD